MIRSTTFRSLIALALLALLLHPAPAQTPSLTPAAEKVRAQVLDLPVGGEVTVNMLNGDEYYGNITSIDAGSFSIHEVDRRADLTLRYEDIRRVRKDYGRKGFTGKRIHPHKTRIVTFIVLGALLGLVIGLVASDKS